MTNIYVAVYKSSNFLDPSAPRKKKISHLSVHGKTYQDIITDILGYRYPSGRIYTSDWEPVSYDDIVLWEDHNYLTRWDLDVGTVVLNYLDKPYRIKYTPFQQWRDVYNYFLFVLKYYDGPFRLFRQGIPIDLDTDIDVPRNTVEHVQVVNDPPSRPNNLIITVTNPDFDDIRVVVKENTTTYGEMAEMVTKKCWITCIKLIAESLTEEDEYVVPPKDDVVRSTDVKRNWIIVHRDYTI